MKAASLNELKAELSSLHPAKVLALCMRLAKYKKENKELLTYMLFEAHDERSYIKGVQDQIDEQFEGLNKSSLYLAKKTVRKVLRTTNKFIKYSGNKETEVQLLIYFCKKIRRSGLPLHANTVLGNLYLRQIQRIKKALSNLHEDLQFDYSKEMEPLM
jgi:superfamily II RNA helicase